MFLCSSRQERGQMTGRRLQRKLMTGFWVMLRSGERPGRSAALAGRCPLAKLLQSC